MPDQNESLRAKPRREHYTESILMAGEGNVKHNCTKMKFDFGKNVSPGQKETKDVTLTSLKPRDKIASQYADVVELGSDASAAGGGRSELSAWQRSARRKPVLSGEATAGHRNRKTHWI